MDRKSFLTALKRTLWWRLPPEELSAVLEDYNEYFDSGIAEGKSEIELCTQFGKPSEIATSIVTERGSRYYSVALASMGLCAGLLLIAIVMLIRPSYFFQLQYGEYVLHIAIMVLAVLSVLLARRTVGTAISARLSRRVTAAHIALYSIDLLVLVLFIECERWITPLYSILDPDKLGPTMFIVLMLTMVCTMSMWLATIFQTAALHRWQLAYIPVNAMLLSMLVSIMCLFSSLSAPESFMTEVVYSIKLAMLQLLPIVLILIPRKGRAK